MPMPMQSNHLQPLSSASAISTSQHQHHQLQHQHQHQHQHQQHYPQPTTMTTWQHDDHFATFRRQQPTRTTKEPTVRQHSASLSAMTPSASISHMANRRRLSSAISDEGGSIKLTRTGRPSKALKGQAVHTCEDCGKVYTRAEHMRRHQRTHSQSLSCDVPGCDRNFNRPDMLQRHKEKHHGSKLDYRRHSVSSKGSQGRNSRSPMPSSTAVPQQPFPAMRSPFAPAQSQSFEVHGMFTPNLGPAPGAVMPHGGAADGWSSLSPLPSSMVSSSLPYSGAAAAAAAHSGIAASEPYPGGYGYSLATPASGTDSWYSPGLSSAPSPSLNSSSMPSAWGSSTSLSLPTTTSTSSWDNASPFGPIDPTFDALQPPSQQSNPLGMRKRDFDLFSLDPNGGRDSRFLLDSYFDQCIESF